ncbi:MAG: SEC-C metal-binding domain-containing protein, partial [Candidatus Komeilibacteria bacterium]|nr:SEC-C metal-binding domain-containing protein [Candidatus Komeilibacteria bacterium]
LSESERGELLKYSERGDSKLDDVERRTKIIEHLVNLSKIKYEEFLVKKVPQLEVMLEIEKQILLRSIDSLWIEHLVAVDYLRTGIGLRGYGQRDPLVEYKKETYRMFNELLSLIQKEVVYSIYKVSLGIQMAPSVMQRGNMIFSGAAKEADGEKAVVASSKPKDAEGHKVGRNDLCPCGSGLKYKKCHGK